MSLLTLTISNIFEVKKGISHIQFYLMPLQTGLKKSNLKQWCEGTLEKEKSLKRNEIHTFYAIDRKN